MHYQLNNVCKRYDKREVLSVESLRIDAGEIVAVVGPSGAGKSTLLRLLAFLEPPTSGTLELHIKNEVFDYESLSIEARRELSMVFQRPALLSRSVRANVAYGLRVRGIQDTDKAVDEVLEWLAIDHLADAMPQTLSGGEMQRVSLARAVVLKPQVLILDEPTANLDPQNIGIIETFLRERHARYQTAIVIVTHNIFQAKRLADRVAFIYQGELVEVQDTDTFFDNPGDDRTAAFTSGHLIY